MLLLLYKEEERKGGKKGRLLGIITLSDVLRYIIGDMAVGNESTERLIPPEEDKVANPPPPQPPSAEEAVS